VAPFEFCPAFPSESVESLEIGSEVEVFAEYGSEVFQFVGTARIGAIGPELVRLVGGSRYYLRENGRERFGDLRGLGDFPYRIRASKNP
jgi:hypothetical protein